MIILFMKNYMKKTVKKRRYSYQVWAEISDEDK